MVEEVALPGNPAPHRRARLVCLQALDALKLMGLLAGNKNKVIMKFGRLREYALKQILDG